MNIKLKAFIYVSTWAIGWILLSSIINSGLISVNLYEAGERGTLITFMASLSICIGGATSLYKEIFPRNPEAKE